MRTFEDLVNECKKFGDVNFIFIEKTYPSGKHDFSKNKFEFVFSGHLGEDIFNFRLRDDGRINITSDTEDGSNGETSLGSYSIDDAITFFRMMMKGKKDE